MTLLASAVNLKVLNIDDAIIGWFREGEPYTTDSFPLKLRENAEAFYRMAQHWLEARGEAAIRALLIYNVEIWFSEDHYDYDELKDSDDFIDELRKLMKR